MSLALKQVLLMLKFMVNLVVASPNSQRSTYRDAHAVPSIFWRYGAKPREQRFRSSSFAKKTKVEVSDKYHASMTLCNIYRIHLSPRASSRCLPLFASRRRLLGLRRRLFRTTACQFAVDLVDLRAKKDYEEVLGKK